MLEWIFNKLVTLAEASNEQKSSLTSDQTAKLNLVFDLIEVITTSTSEADKKIRRPRSLITLELYALINPLLFWLDYSIERPERFPLFKQVWRTLSKVLSQLP
jgi:hypothetical protein